MNNEQKLNILAQINEYQATEDMSQNKLASALGVNAATLSKIKNKKWQSISADMWQKVAAFFVQNTTSTVGEWQIFDTDNFATIKRMCQEAKKHQNMYCVIGDTGVGKTVALKHYAERNPDTYYVLCKYMMSDTTFLKAIAKSINITVSGRKLTMFERLVSELQKQDKPVILLDDVGKLPLQCYRIIQLLFDELENNCGIVIAGVPHLEATLRKNAERNKMSFPELVRRFRNKEWRLLGKPTKKEILYQAIRYGITDKYAVKYLYQIINEYQHLRDIILDAKRIAIGGEITLEILQAANEPLKRY